MGLLEVLVALILIAIGVLGYVALQVRAMDASSEALSKSQAIMLMRGLAENIRVNSSQASRYPHLSVVIAIIHLPPQLLRCVSMQLVHLLSLPNLMHIKQQEMLINLA